MKRKNSDLAISPESKKVKPTDEDDLSSTLSYNSAISDVIPAPMNDRKKEIIELMQDAQLNPLLRYWMLDSNDVELGNVLGAGSFGVVRQGSWKGLQVAVCHCFCFFSLKRLKF
jgi:hypothetical protein